MTIELSIKDEVKSKAATNAEIFAAFGKLVTGEINMNQFRNQTDKRSLNGTGFIKTLGKAQVNKTSSPDWILIS